MYFTFDKININYQHFGQGEPILFLHGWGTNGAHFLDIGEKLSQKYSVYLLDLPGFGKSEEPHNAYTLDNYVTVVEKFIKELNIKDPIIIGHSFGGRIGIRYSTKFDVKNLILIDSAGIKRQTLKTKIKIYKYKLKKKIFIKTRAINKLEKLIETSGSSDYLSATPIMKKTLSNVVGVNQKHELKKIKCETLLLWGKLDTITPYKDALLIKKRIKNSGLVAFDDSQHFPYLEEPTKFKKVLLNYLKVSEE